MTQGGEQHRDPMTARNERSCHQRQSSWNSFVFNMF
jgi:hypothetical protein